MFAGYLGEPRRTQEQHRRLVGHRRHRPRRADHLAVEDLLLDRLPELAELVLTTTGDDIPVPIGCTYQDTALDPARWQAATADLPPLAAFRQVRWVDLPTTATWKVRRSVLSALLTAQPPPPGAPATGTAAHH